MLPVSPFRLSPSVLMWMDDQSSQAKAPPVGSTTGSGLAIGGVNGSSKQFYGDIIEVAFLLVGIDAKRHPVSHVSRISGIFSNLKGYYKLGYSTNAADFLPQLLRAYAPIREPTRPSQPARAPSPSARV